MSVAPSSFAILRARHPELVYESFAVEETPDALALSFHFSLAGGPAFRPTLRLPRPAGPLPDRRLLENLAFHVGLIELMSYWKAACPPVIRLRAGRLDAAQQAWWGDLYRHGLGEFFYLNGIEPPAGEALVRFVDDGGPVFAPLPVATEDRNLIPVGGGKDSLVTLRLLEPFHDRNLCFFLNPSRAQEESARLLGYGPDQIVAARRTLDPALLALNREGYLNGHTPFSALLGFTTVLAAAIHGASRIVLSNESSANESTVAGSTVNHQYSKSWEFERAFRGYVEKYLAPSVSYFSFLRPWNELRIAQRIAADPAALAVFRSCNVGSKQDRWCGACAKCLFVDILLAPFAAPGQRAAIFGGVTPLDRIGLRPLFEELIGAVPVKPFECVGTVEEVGAALTLALREGRTGALLDVFRGEYAGLAVAPERIAALLAEFNPHHAVPEAFAALLRN